MDTQTERARLKTSVDLLVDNLHKENIILIAVELLKLNLYKAKYLLVEKLMRTTARPNKPAWIYASLVNVLNTKVPELGSALINRLVLYFKYNYVHDKPLRLDFLCELVNYKVLSNLVILQILELLMSNITDDSVALTVKIVKLNGAGLPPAVLYPVVDKLRNLVTEGAVNAQNKEAIGKLLEIRRKGFRDFTRILVDKDMCHDVDLEDDFEYNEEEEEEKEYPDFASELIRELNLEGNGDLEHTGSEKQDASDGIVKAEAKEEVVDMSQTELISLQKTVYLTIMSSLSSEEAVHKLLKLRYEPKVLANIVIRSCVQEKTYSKYYSVICEILILKFSSYRKEFSNLFTQNYETIHQFELNGIRNFGKLYGYLIATEKLPISVLQCVKLTEEDTNSSNRILMKFLLKEMVEEMGTNDFKELLLDNTETLPGIFQLTGKYDDLIFAINFFTAIGLGMLTDQMRMELESRQRGRKRDRRDSASSYSRSGSSYSRSRSGSYRRSRSRSYSRSRSRSYSRSGSERSP